MTDNVNKIARQKFESIDMLRGTAIIMVILVHIRQVVSGVTKLTVFARFGQMGVQMFFIASAFTLCYSMDIRCSESRPYLSFYIRRFFRIAPGYYAGIFIYYLVSLITGFHRSAYTPITVLANVFFVNGLYPPANNMVVPGGWSIGTEMLFYLILPLIVKIYKIFNKKIWLYLIPLISIMFNVVVVCIATVNKESFAVTNNSFYYFSIFNQLPVFLTGISLYYLFKRGYFEKVKPLWSFVSFFGIMLISGYMFFRPTMLTFVLIPFLTGIAFSFLFIFLQYSTRYTAKWIMRMGDLSYSCYLLHIFFVYIVSAYLSRTFVFLQGDIGMILLFIFVIVITFVFAKAFYKYIEIPGIALGKKIVKKEQAYIDKHQL